MGFLKSKILAVSLLGLLSLLIVPNAQAACANFLSGVFCGGDQVACRSDDGTIKCTTTDKCDPDTQKCVGVVTPPNPPGPTPAYLDVSASQNDGYLKINKYVEVLGDYLKAAGNLIVDGLATIQNLTVPGQLKLTSGAGTGRVLVSDAEGLASWQVLPEVPFSTTTPPATATPNLFEVLSQGADASAFYGNVLLGNKNNKVDNKVQRTNLTTYGYVRGLRVIANQANATSTFSGNVWTKKNLTVNGNSVLGKVSATDISANSWMVGDSNTYLKASLIPVNIAGFNGNLPVLSGKTTLSNNSYDNRPNLLNGAVLLGENGAQEISFDFIPLADTSKNFSIIYDLDDDSVSLTGGNYIANNYQPLNNFNLTGFNSYNFDEGEVNFIGGDVNFVGGDVNFTGDNVSLSGGYNGANQKLFFGGGPDANGQGGSGEYIYSERDTSTDNYWNLVFATGFIDAMTINTDGNVGIGTDNPQNKLEVNGGITSKSLDVGDNGRNLYISSSEWNNGMSISGSEYVENLFLSFNGYSFARGDVNLIGGYDGATQKLNFGGGGEYIYSERDDTLNTKWSLNFAVNGIDSMTIANGGDIGIGTNLPSEKLEISNGSLLLGNDGGKIGLKIKDINQNSQMILSVNGADQTLLNGGNQINFTTNYGNDSIMKAMTSGVLITAGNGNINDPNSGYYFSDPKNTLHLWNQSGANAGLTIQSLYDRRWNINHDRATGALYIAESDDDGSNIDNAIIMGNGLLKVNGTIYSSGLDVTGNIKTSNVFRVGDKLGLTKTINVRGSDNKDCQINVSGGIIFSTTCP